MRLFKPLFTLIILFPVFLLGCIDDSDDDDDENSDSSWTAQTSDINQSYDFIDPSTTIDDVRAHDAGTTSIRAKCYTIGVDNGAQDDSKRIKLTFDGQGHGTLSVQVFLGDLECNQLTPDSYDYADSVSFSYVLSSSSFDYNRFDITVSKIERHVKTAGAETALEAETACGKTEWAVDEVLTDISGCDANANSDFLAGFQFNDAAHVLGGSTAMPLAVGTILEGVQTWSGGTFKLLLGPEGDRPSATVDTHDDYYLLNGGAFFFR